VHAAALALPAEGTRFYASSLEELDVWIERGFSKAVASPGGLPRTPSSGVSSRKAQDQPASLGRSKSGSNILAKGLEIIRHKSGNKSPRGGTAALFE
jgi:hypothetical protein